MAKVDMMGKDRKKYIDGEEVLFEYSLEVSFFKEIIFLIVGGSLYGYAKSKNFDLNIFWMIVSIALISGFLYFLIRDIKTLQTKSVYITQNYFITHGGEKINVQDIYYHHFDFFNPSGFCIGTELGFYQNNRFLFYCKVNESDTYITFINTLIMISKNDALLKPIMTYHAKQKLIPQGENNGRAN